MGQTQLASHESPQMGCFGGGKRHLVINTRGMSEDWMLAVIQRPASLAVDTYAQAGRPHLADASIALHGGGGAGARAITGSPGGTGGLQFRSTCGRKE